MEFERNQDPKEALGIGLKPLSVKGISFLKGIDYCMSGETWKWKVIPIWRLKKVHEILRRIKEGTNKKEYAIITSENTFYTDSTNSREGYGVYGKIFTFEGITYKIPEEY